MRQDIQNMWIGIGIFLFVLFAVNVFNAWLTDRDSETFERSKKIDKLAEKSDETNSLSRAVDYYHQASDHYEQIKDIADADSKWFCEDNLKDIRENAESLAKEKWEDKTSAYLDKMYSAYEEILGWDFKTVEKSYASKTVFFRAYDAYFSWTSDFFDENCEIWHDVNLWDEARDGIKNMLEDVDPTYHYTYWGDPSFGKLSVRAQIDKRLTAQIESMRPEYKRKKNLKNLILQTIAQEGSIQRSVLLKKPFEGFVAAEVRACYRGLVQEHSIIEVKQGNYYFSSLSDKAAAKFAPKQNSE